MPRAIHRLHAELAVVDAREIHAVAKVIVMARAVPQLDIEDLRRYDFLITVARVQAGHVSDQAVVNRGAFGMKERALRRDRMKAEEIELAAEPPMVAVFRLDRKSVV